MKLTKIEKQKHKADRYSLYVDDEFWMGVDENILVQFGLLRAQEIDKALMEAIRHAEFEQGVYHKAIQYLAYSMKTRKEVATYLEDRFQAEMAQSPENYQMIQDVIKTTLEKLEDMGYINDEAYVQAYLNTQALLSPKGPKLLRQALLKKGIDTPLIDESLSHLDVSDYRDGALRLAEKYIRSKSRLPMKKQEEKVRELLYRKGYGQDVIGFVMETLTIEEDADLQQEMLDREGRKAHQKFSRQYEGYQLKAKIKESLVRKGYHYDQIRDWLETFLTE